MCSDTLSIADNSDLQCPVPGGGQVARAGGGHSRCVSSFCHIAAFCSRSPKATSLRRGGGILYMCLRCDMLLLDPGFVFTVTLGGDSLTRLFSRPLDLCLFPGPQTAPFCWGSQAHLQLLEPPLLNYHRFQISGPQMCAAQSQHGRGPPPRAGPFCVPTRVVGVHPPTKQNPLSIPETAALGGCPGSPTGSWNHPSLGKGGLGTVAACACPDGTFSTHCLPSLNGPTVIRSRSPASLCPSAMHHASWVLLPLMGATRDGCFLGKTNVCEPPHLCRSSKRRAHDWPAGPRTSDCLPLGSLVVTRGRLGWCPVARRVSGAAICPGRASAPVPAGSALLAHAVPFQK